MKYGRTDEGLRYEVLRSPDDPPIMFAVEPRPGTHWTDAGVRALVGQSLGFRWNDRVHLLRIVASSVNVVDRRCEVVLK